MTMSPPDSGHYDTLPDGQVCICSSCRNHYSASVTSGLDITAFIAAWFFPPLGAILGMVGVSEAHKQGRTASGLAAAAVVVGVLATLVFILVVIVAANHHPTVFTSYTQCMNDPDTTAAQCAPLAGTP